MDSTWPIEVVDLDAFLTKAGFTCRRCEKFQDFNNKLVQYDNTSIGIRITSDRGLWIVAVSEVINQPSQWYDIALIRDFIIGTGRNVLTLAEQIQILEINWQLIVNCFNAARKEDTHARLAILREKRLKRLFPNLHRRTA